jgi:hypothetical protein
MGLIITDSQYYTDIASAIRAKLSTSTTYLPEEMAAAIETISGGGGVTPSGTINISSNGVFDVYNYASASVSVPVGIFPSGTYSISSNGIYNISEYASVDVDVPTPDYMLKYQGANLLTSFTDLSSTTVVYGAFAYTSSLATVSFPAATTVGNYAFAYCYRLSSAYFPELKTINTYAFEYCSSLWSGKILSSEMLPKVSGTLGGYAFRGCQYLSGVSLSLVTSLGAQAFSGCSRIKSVDLSALTFAQAGAFSYCTTCSSYSLPLLKTVGSSCFYSNWSLTTITLPSATTISGYAFRYCSNLMSIVLPGSTVVNLPTSTTFNNMPVTASVDGVYGSIYVPSSLLTSYKAATN